MPNTNLSSNHYTDDEIALAQSLFDQLRALIKPRTQNLLPAERQRYGSIREQSKLLVLKDLGYHEHMPQLDSADVDWTEQEADWKDRSFLETVMSGSLDLMQMADNTRILHDYDCYQNALVDYAYTQYKAENSTEAGWETKYNDLKQFMPNTGGGGNSGGGGAVTGVATPETPKDGK